jgi:hypothetical protein
MKIKKKRTMVENGYEFTKRTLLYLSAFQSFLLAYYSHNTKHARVRLGTINLIPTFKTQCSGMFRWFSGFKPPNSPTSETTPL